MIEVHSADQIASAAAAAGTTAEGHLRTVYLAARRRLLGAPRVRNDIAEIAAEKKRRIAVYRSAKFQYSWESMIALATVHQATTRAVAEIVKPVSLDEIVRQTCAKWNFTAVELLSHQRTFLLALARHEACWRAMRENGAGCRRIGKAFGGRDHSTIFYAAARYQELVSAKVRGDVSDKRIPWDMICDVAH